jgi:replicative DNA helicase
LRVSKLPHSVEAERALLGAVLFDDAHLEACDRLTPDHFYDPVNARIYATARAMAAAGRKVDQNTVSVRLAADASLEDAGGARRVILEIVAAAARTRVAVADYARLLIDLSVRREVIRVARELEGLAISPPDGEGGAQVRERAEQALRAIDDGVVGAGVTLRAAGELAMRNARADRRGIPTGYKALDDLIGGLFAPDVIVLAGRPAMGKTSLAANVAHSVALREYGVHFASNEMSAEQIAQRALSRASYGQDQAFPYRSFRRGGVPMDYADSLVRRLPENFVIDDTGGQTLSHLAAQLRATRKRLGRLDVVVIDYLQLMRDEAVRRGETAEITALTKGIKQLAKDFGVAIILLSQLSRDVEKREDKRPFMADLRQSGSIEQDADIILFAFREEYYLIRNEPKRREGEDYTDFDVRYHQWANECEEKSGKMEIIGAKVRMDEVGTQVLTVDLAYDVAIDPPQQQPSYHNRGAA